MSFPFKMTFPSAIFIRPAIASAISTCPFPATPAIAKTSPPRTEKLTFFTTEKPSRFFTVRFCTSKTVLPNFGSAFSTVKFTSRPTMRFAIVFVLVSATSKTSMSFPLFKIAQRSATCLISSSLWVIRIIVFPLSLSPRIISKRKLISCGVSTAVGSSKIRISASR